MKQSEHTTSVVSKRRFGRRWLAIISMLSLLAGLIAAPSASTSAASTTTLALSPSVQNLTVGTQASISVTFTNTAPLSDPSGVTIRYTVSGANNFSGSTTTGAFGAATIQYTGNFGGTDTISAYADLNTNGVPDSGEPTATATINWSGAGGTYLSLNPASQTVAPGSTAVISVHLSLSGASVGSRLIRYTVTGPNARSGTAVTNGSGNTAISYSGTNTGTDTVTAYADLNGNGVQNSGEPGSSATVTWSTSTTATLSLSPSSQTLQPGTNASISVHLTNPSGSINNVLVRYSVSGPNATSGTVSTNSSGNTTISYYGANTGTDTVTAYADLNGNAVQNSGEPGSSATVTWSTTTSATLSLSPSVQTLQPGINASISVSLTNPGGSVNNVLIRYSVSGPNATSGTVTTNSSGNATITYYGANTGTDTVTVFADFNSNGSQGTGEPGNTATVYWSTSAAALTLSPSTQTLLVGTNASISVHLSISNTNLSGILVRYSVSGANSTSGTVTTNSSGNATISYHGSNSGTDAITAFADLNGNGSQGSGEPGSSATVVWSSTALTLAPSTQTALRGTQVQVVATYVNAGGTSSGATLRYVVSGANSTSGTLTTDVNGHATIAYTGSNLGTDTVSAYIDTNNNGSQDTGEPSATATVTWTSTATLTLSPAASSIGVGTTAYIAVSLTSSGTGIAGVPIRFTVTGANPNSGSMTTAGNGQTVLSYNGYVAGTDTVSAYADLNKNGVKDSGEPAASTTITWTSSVTPPAPPSTTFQPAQPTGPKPGCTYFAATQHNLCAGFQAFWYKFGGMQVYGLPLTEEFQLNGVTTQFFERAEFQWYPGTWPARYDVLLGLVGNEVTAGRGGETPFQSTTASSAAGCTYYAATGHNLCGAFADFWNQHGALPNFGYPISEQFQERNPDTGQIYTVQYFQRARFELHPGSTPGTYTVELGRLGAQVLQLRFGVNYY